MFRLLIPYICLIDVIGSLIENKVNSALIILIFNYRKKIFMNDLPGTSVPITNKEPAKL